MIIIDPGHGGSDIGGGSNNFWQEKDLALKISLYQYQRFLELGIKVNMTRNSDLTLSPLERTNKAKSYSTGKNDLIISNHINVDFGNYDGAEVVYSKYDSNALAKLIAKNLEAFGQKLSTNEIYTRLNSRGEDYYYIIRNTRPIQTVLIEYGFADSKGDDINQLLYNWQALAEALVKSVCEYFGYKYTYNLERYTVKENDTLSKIAQKYNTTVDAIRNLNGLTSDLIYPGDSLLIPKNN